MSNTDLLSSDSKFITGVDVEFDYSKNSVVGETSSSKKNKKKNKKKKNKIKVKSSSDLLNMDQYPESRVIKQGDDGELVVSPLDHHNESEEFQDDYESDAEEHSHHHHHHHHCDHEDDDHHHHQHSKQQQHHPQHHHHHHDHEHDHDCQRHSKHMHDHHHPTTSKRSQNRRGGKNVVVDSDSPDRWVPSSQEEQQQLKKFWSGLSMADKQKFLAVDKNEVFTLMEREKKSTCTCKSCARENFIVSRIVTEIFEDYDSTFGNVIIAKFLEDKELMASLLKEQKAKREQQQQEYIKLEKQLKLEQQKRQQRDREKSPKDEDITEKLRGVTNYSEWKAILEAEGFERQSSVKVPLNLSDHDLGQLMEETPRSSTPAPTADVLSAAADERSSDAPLLPSEFEGVTEAQILSLAQDLLKTDGKYFLEIMEKLETNPALKAVDISKQISRVLGILNKGVFGLPNPDLTAVESVLSEFRHWENQKAQAEAEKQPYSDKIVEEFDDLETSYVDDTLKRSKLPLTWLKGSDPNKNFEYGGVDLEDEVVEDYDDEAVDDEEDDDDDDDDDDEEEEEEEDDVEFEEYDDEEDEDDQYDDIDEIDEEKLSAEATRDTYSKIQSISFKIVHSRLVSAYKEKVAEDSTRQLIEELEAEERRKKEKEEKKQRQKEKLKEKKRQQQLLKEEEKRKKEEAKAEQERLLKEEQQRKMEEGRRKKEEQKRKKEEERKAKLEAQKRKEQEAERLKKEKEEKETQRLEEKRRQGEELKLKQQEEARLKLEQEQAEARRVKVEAEAKRLQDEEQIRRAQEEAERAEQAEQERLAAIAEAKVAAVAATFGNSEPPQLRSASLSQHTMSPALNSASAPPPPGLMRSQASNPEILPQGINDILKQAMHQQQQQQQQQQIGIPPSMPSQRITSNGVSPWGGYHDPAQIPLATNAASGYSTSLYPGATSALSQPASTSNLFSPFAPSVPSVDSRRASELDISGLNSYMSSMGLSEPAADVKPAPVASTTPSSNLWQSDSSLLANGAKSSIWGQTPRLASYNNGSQIGGSLWSNQQPNGNGYPPAPPQPQQLSYNDAELVQISAFKSSSMNLVKEPGTVIPTSALLLYTKPLLPSLPNLTQEQFVSSLSLNLAAKLGFSFEFFFDDLGHASHVRINIAKDISQQQQLQPQMMGVNENAFSPFGSSTGLSTLNGLSSVWGSR